MDKSRSRYGSNKMIKSRAGTIFWHQLPKLLVLLMFISYFLFFQPPWLEYRNSPFPVITGTVKPGEIVVFTVLRCNLDSSTRTYSTTRRLVNHVGNVTEMTNARLPMDPGCIEQRSAFNIIPPGTPPGMYHLEGTASVQGTVRTFTVPWATDEFKVVN